MKLFDFIKENKDNLPLLSETQFYTVTSVNQDSIIVNSDSGEEGITLSKSYVNTMLQDTGSYRKEWKATQTELQEVFKANPNKVMTVGFKKKAKKKEIAELLSDVYPNQGSIISKKDFTNTVQELIYSVLEGDSTIRRGYHSSHYATPGRVYFTDMDKEKIEGKYDNRIIQVDLRTIFEIIVNNVRYVLK
jgi:hypothetical protein